ncbi:MAG: methyltransferase domain-containing protein [Dehalococcoidia bacterium]|nr:methyltransferase domain-containing protein [Dehalococcoidia bacterium]
MQWDPQRYHQFQAERSAPFDDLVKLIVVRDGADVVDLGCGPGELTSRLANMLPNSSVLGVDSSANMLAKARQLETPALRFRQQTIESLEGQWDLVFSNAAIQWLDDHRSLIPRLLSMVRPGGQMVIQLPSNHMHATQTLMADVAREEPFRTAFNGWAREFSVLSIEEYAEILYTCGAAKITVFEKVYPQVVKDAQALLDWSRGTALLPYLERLSDDLRSLYLDLYLRRLKQRWPGSPVFFPFRRIIMAATRPVG